MNRLGVILLLVAGCGETETDPAVEVCDGSDNDCDGFADDETAADAETFYVDGDKAGYGAAEYPVRACTAPAGTVTNADDFDGIGATEVCDGVDTDCDGSISEEGMVAWVGPDGARA